MLNQRQKQLKHATRYRFSKPQPSLFPTRNLFRHPYPISIPLLPLFKTPKILNPALNNSRASFSWLNRPQSHQLLTTSKPKPTPIQPPLIKLFRPNNYPARPNSNQLPINLHGRMEQPPSKTRFRNPNLNKRLSILR